MKKFQTTFKTLLCLLLIALVFTNCRDGKETEKTNADTSSNSEQENKSSVTSDENDALSPNQSKSSGTSIAEQDGGATSPDLPDGNNAPIVLDCNYFKDNPNSILKDNPEATVDYIITCVAKVSGKLTVDPGVVIAFEQDAGLEFNSKSSFKMEGTAEKPIVLTGKESIKGFWRGVYTESPSLTNVMKYVTIDYAGGNAKAALTIYKGHSALTLDHCTISNSKSNGMFVNDAVGKGDHNIVMNNCTFTKNNIPVQTNITRLRMFNGSNHFTGNQNDYIYIDREALHGDATWAKLDVPYFLQTNFTYKEGVLTVEPGTEIIMSAQNYMHLSNKASLKMVGTADDPIIIRGEHDVAGFWEQLNIDSSSPINEIGHVIFKNAGRTTKKPNGAVFLGRSKFLNIHDVIFSNCVEFGISVQDVEQSHLAYANLSLDNTPKLFSDYSGKEITAPDSK